MNLNIYHLSCHYLYKMFCDGSFFVCRITKTYELIRLNNLFHKITRLATLESSFHLEFFDPILITKNLFKRQNYSATVAMRFPNLRVCLFQYFDEWFRQYLFESHFRASAVVPAIRSIPVFHCSDW